MPMPRRRARAPQILVGFAAPKNRFHRACCTRRARIDTGRITRRLFSTCQRRVRPELVLLVLPCFPAAYGCPKPGLRHGGAAGRAADCTCAGCPEPLCRAGLPQGSSSEVLALPDRSLLQQGLPGDALESWPFEGVPGGAGRSRNPSRRRRARAPGPAPSRVAARGLRRRGGQDARPARGLRAYAGPVIVSDAAGEGGEAM